MHGNVLVSATAARTLLSIKLGNEKTRGKSKRHLCRGFAICSDDYWSGNAEDYYKKSEKIVGGIFPMVLTHKCVQNVDSFFLGLPPLNFKPAASNQVENVLEVITPNTFLLFVLMNSIFLNASNKSLGDPGKDW
jgi:hypothetical protein